MDDRPMRPPPSDSPRPTRRIWIGSTLSVVCAIGFPLSLVAMVLSANACGAFGDGCEDYGKVGDDFVPSTIAAIVCGVGFVVGRVLLRSRPR